MKNPYIANYICSRLHTFVRCISGAKDAVFIGNIVDFSDEPFGTAVLSSAPAAKNKGDIPLILSVSGLFVYGLVTHAENRFLIGPLRFEEEVFFSHILTLEKLRIPTDVINEEWLLSVPLANFGDFIDSILLLHNYRKTGSDGDEFLTKERIQYFNCISQEEALKGKESLTKLQFENRENLFVHNPYNHEARECTAIENGDVDALRRVLSEVFTGRYGTLSKNPLRQEINMGIVAITLATRAAIRGGLHPETAFYISDITIQRMEAQTDVPSVTHIYRSAEYDLTKMVNDLKETKTGDMPARENRHISHCKDYIFTHLHDRLQVQEIADAIGLEPNYLSALFKKCEHMTLKHYITNEKIKLVKNLLVYSSYPYSKISAYLGFASQSHLGAEFKKITGMTLKEYREKFAREDFVHDQMFRE